MIDTLAQKHPDIIETCETLAADRGYDDTKLHVKLWNNHGIKALIDTRNMWKDKGQEDPTRVLQDYENVVYYYKGNVYCVCMETGIQREMCVGGIKKMKIRCSIALSIMLAMAVGRIKQNQGEMMRSLVKAA